MRATATAVCLALTLGVAGCTNTHRDAPEPAPGQVHDIINPYVVTNPNGFRNVLIGCDGLGDMLFITSRGTTGDTVTSGLFVIPNDPRCLNKHN